MDKVKAVFVLLLSLQLGGCLGIMVEALPKEFHPTHYKRTMSVTGTGYGVESAKATAMFYDQFTPQSFVLCETRFSSTETKELGFSKSADGRRKRTDPGDSRNRVSIQKTVETCPDENTYLRRRNQGHWRVQQRIRRN